MAFCVSKEVRLFLYVVICCTVIYGVIFSKLQGSRIMRRINNTDVQLTIGNLIEASGMSHLRSALNDIGFPAVATNRVTRRRRPIPRNYRYKGSSINVTSAKHHAAAGTGSEMISFKVNNKSDSIRGPYKIINEPTQSQENESLYLTYSADRTGVFPLNRETNEIIGNEQIIHESELREILRLWKDKVLQDTEVYISRREETTNITELNELQKLSEVKENVTDEQNASITSETSILFEMLNDWRDLNLNQKNDQTEGYLTNSSETPADVSSVIGYLSKDITDILQKSFFANATGTVYLKEESYNNQILNASYEAATGLLNNTEATKIEINEEHLEADGEKNVTFATGAYETLEIGESSDTVLAADNELPRHSSVLQSQAAYDFKFEGYPTRIESDDIVFPSGVSLYNLPPHIQDTINLNVREDEQSVNDDIATENAELKQPGIKDNLTEVRHDNLNETINNMESGVTLSQNNYASQYKEILGEIVYPDEYKEEDNREQLLPTVYQSKIFLQDDQISASSAKEISNNNNSAADGSETPKGQEYVQKLHEYVNLSYKSIAEQLRPKWTAKETDLGYPKVNNLEEMPELPLPHHIPLNEQIGFMDQEDRDQLAFTTLNHVEDHFKVVDQNAAPHLERLEKELNARNKELFDQRSESLADHVNTEDHVNDKLLANKDRISVGSQEDQAKEGLYSRKEDPVIKFKSSMGVVPLELLKEEVVIKPKPSKAPTSEKAQQSERVPPTSKTRAPKNTNVIFYSYLRGGSSIGSELFNLDPQAFLWYEPLDAFYSAHFGIPHKTLPGNILYWNNGTKRELMFDERRWLVNAFRNMFECKLNELPPDVFTHELSHKSTRFRAFTDCYKNIKDKITIDTCRVYTIPTCGRTIEKSINEQCHVVLEATRRIRKNLPTKFGGSFYLKDPLERKKYVDMLQKTIKEMRVNLFGQAKHVLGDFIAHQICVNAMSQQISRCLPKATEVCQKNKLHVAKVLRLRFDDMEELTFLYPDLKVIYFPRDPRAIAYSRAEHGLLKNPRNLHYAEEARFLCARMRNDLAKKEVLESRYPGKVLTISYEFMARHPHLYAEKVYKHLQHKMPEGWLNLMKRNSKAAADNGPFGLVRRDPLKTALNWKKKVNVLGRQTMTHRCQFVLEKLHYDL